ncbi:hypothetical protein FRC06_003950 [Ceratobasidium sp. 370]|nr:hypothetical protein FRC06_003950 [Ceratobasidium sp. 370]
MRTIVQSPSLGHTSVSVQSPEPVFTPPLAPFPPAFLAMDRRQPSATPPSARANLELLLNAIDDGSNAPETPTNASSDPAISIHSLLAASQALPSPPPLPWQAETPGAGPSTLSAPPAAPPAPEDSSGKRKRDEATSPEESRAKIRRTVRDHLVLDYARVLPTPSMTTVVCLHAAVAQKSYGNEKRFLCPPPVVRVEGPLRQPRNQQLAMRIVTETGERTNEQRSSLDEMMQASFKTLHVSGTAGLKAKNFQLVLDVTDPDSPLGNTPWASFESTQIAIISKPSKKTAKTRNMSSCILAGGPVSLFNRINSQTVRTKYMAIEGGRLSASNSAWSAFSVTVVRSPAESDDSPETVPAQLSSPTQASSTRAGSVSLRSYSSSVGARPVTYGSEIILTDQLTGVASDPLIIRKVDKSRIINDDGGPVSQMQKIALQRIGDDGQRYYLSASGTITGPGFGGNAGTNGLGLTDVRTADRQVGPQTLHYQAPRTREERSVHGATVVDEVDDWLCWTIVGISKFQYTFFDALGTFGTTPSRPITPFPTICTQPTYRPSTHTLELVVSNFSSDNPETGQSEPLEIWLGNIGPLRQRIYRSNPSSGNMPAAPPPSVPYAKAAAGALPSIADPSAVISAAAKAVLDFVDKPGASANERTPGSSSTSVFRRSSVMSPSQTIVVVDMPPIPDIVRTMQENVMSPGHLLAAGLLSQVAQQAQVSRRKEGDGASARERTDEAAERTAAIASALAAATEGAAGTVPVVPPEALEPGAPPSAHMARGLPLLFIRASDGAGYHSGRSVACESVFASGATGEWVQAAQAVAGAANGSGLDACLTLRVV